MNLMLGVTLRWIRFSSRDNINIDVAHPGKPELPAGSRCCHSQPKNINLWIIRPWQTRTHCYGQIVADTNVSPFACARNICCGVRNKSFPVCAAQETSRATMCPQQCVLFCQYLYSSQIGLVTFAFNCLSG